MYSIVCFVTPYEASRNLALQVTEVRLAELTMIKEESTMAIFHNQYIGCVPHNVSKARLGYRLQGNAKASDVAYDQPCDEHKFAKCIEQQISVQLVELHDNLEDRIINFDLSYRFVVVFASFGTHHWPVLVGITEMKPNRMLIDQNSAIDTSKCSYLCEYLTSRVSCAKKQAAML